MRSITQTLPELRLVESDRLGMLGITVHIQPPVCRKQSVMHRPIGSLIAGATSGERSGDPWSLIGAGIILVEKPHLARVDIARLNLGPGFFEKFEAVAAREIRILNQRHRRIRLAPHTMIDRRRTRRDGPSGDQQEQEERRPDSGEPPNDGGHAVTLLARIRSSSPTMSSGQTTVASLSTSAKRPPSAGGTNLPQEMPS